MLQKRTIPWCSEWKRKRKRNLASQFPLISFLTDAVLLHGKLTLTTPVSPWLLRNLGTMLHGTLFSPSPKVEALYLCVDQVLTKRDRHEERLRESEKVHNVFVWVLFVCLFIGFY